MGAVTPIGSGVEEYWNNLIAGACGIDKIRQFDATDLAVRIAAEVHSFDLQKYMPKKMIHETDAFTQYAYVAAAEALAMAGKKDGERSGENARMSGDPDGSAGIGLPADPDQMGIVMGTAMAGVATTAATQEILTNAVHKNVGPRFVPRILGNIAAAQIAIAHGITGHSVTLSTACASGGDAVSAAAMLLQADEADAILAVGAESILCPLVIYSLANAHTLSRMNDDPQHSCRPFDAHRSGFVIGEMKEAGALPEEIDYINAHGTGTKLGDEAELNALGQLFESSAISSTKGATGHMMGAGGITEAIACIQAIREGIVPPTLNLEDCDSDLDLVRGESRKMTVDTAMTNAFGFGGQNSSLIFRRY